MLSSVMTVFAFVQEDVLKGLEIFWKGMLAIFIVLAAIALITYLLNLTARKLSERKEKRNDTDQSGTPPTE